MEIWGAFHFGAKGGGIRIHENGRGGSKRERAVFLEEERHPFKRIFTAHSINQRRVDRRSFHL